MTQRLRRRLRGADAESGVYAILYAILVVVMIGMAAIVVDIASVREDRRDNRSASDSAALAGIAALDASTGGSPFLACQRVWDQLLATVKELSGSHPCGPFATVNVATYCIPTTPPMIRAEKTVGQITVVIAWPVPRDADQGFLSASIAPADSATQNQDFSGGPDGADGSDNGCDRLGVAMLEDQEFGLAAALAGTGTTSSVHSVARFDPTGGPDEDVAALNILNKTACDTLTTSGLGKVLVDPTVDGTTVAGPGRIAVESDGSACGGGSARVINPGTATSELICAASTPIMVSGGSETCDGLGTVEAHALDPGGAAAKAYNANATAAGTLKPIPVPQGGTYSWFPVTRLYGCEGLDPCPVTGSRNNIALLKAALGGSGAPTANYAAAAPYLQPFPGSFADSSAVLCPGGGGIKTTVLLTPGNHWANCTLDISGGGQVILPSGTLVVEDGINIGSGGCLVVNYTTCAPTLQGAGTSAVAPNPAPVTDGLVYIRGKKCPSVGCFFTAGTTVMPQTFVFSAAAGGRITVKSTELTLWTAPGAGPVTAGRTALETACLNVLGEVDQSCLNSRFSRIAYWSEFAARKTQPNDFAGQGSLNVVGVFFTPTAFFDFTGGGDYKAAAAQFWTDSLRVTGGARLGLRPDQRFAVLSPSARLSLIR